MIDDLEAIDIDDVPRCVVCHVTVEEHDGGLCDEHKYDEQLDERYRPGPPPLTDV